MKRACKDCKAAGLPLTRLANKPGPRCATHHRARLQAARAVAHERMVKKTYGLAPGDYLKLLNAQDGACYICTRAKGKTKRLAVDHDHATGYVRGLLCGPCNKILGHFRDDPDMAMRAAEYLTNPPAFDVIGQVRPDDS